MLAGAAAAFYAGAVVMQHGGPMLVALLIGAGGTMGLMYALFRPAR